MLLYWLTSHYSIDLPDLVVIGGNVDVKLSREDYEYARAAHKPTVLALRLTDKLFSKETLLKSTVSGTKEFPALDFSKIAAIKGNSIEKNCVITEFVC